MLIYFILTTKTVIQVRKHCVLFLSVTVIFKVIFSELFFLQKLSGFLALYDIHKFIFRYSDN